MFDYGRNWEFFKVIKLIGMELWWYIHTSMHFQNPESFIVYGEPKYVQI